jgi:hypothetical protein
MTSIDQVRPCPEGQTSNDPVVLLQRGIRQLQAWHESYGLNNPHWLPPGGDVRWMEEATEYINAQRKQG